MTRRERAEARAARRREWAEGRAAKADAALDTSATPYADDWAFLSQPGRIPQRDALNRRAEKAAEHGAMARHHAAKAAGIERQLDHTIFDDDPDACDRLRERIAETERERAEYKAFNAKQRKAGGDILPSYVLTNLGARIRRDRERLARLEAAVVAPPPAAPIRVFKVNEIDWWAGADFASCYAACMEWTGMSDAEMDGGDLEPLGPEAMAEMIFHDIETDERRTFREELDRMVAQGAVFPQPFASEEY